MLFKSVLLVHLTPLQISAVQRFDQKLCRREVRGHGNVVHIAEFNDVVDVGLMSLGGQRIAPWGSADRAGK